MHVLDHFDADRIRALCASGHFFWLDLTAPTDAQIGELAEILDLPPLAVEDTIEFHQRPKVDDYGERLLIVFYGAEPTTGGAQLMEVHVHLAPGRVVTVHRERCGLLESVREAHAHSDQEVVYRIFDTLSESVLAYVRGVETEVSGLEQRAFESPSAADRRRITELRARLFRLMQVIEPQRDMLAGGGAAIERVLAMERGDRARAVEGAPPGPPPARRRARRPRPRGQPRRLRPRAARRGPERLPADDVQPTQRDRHAPERAGDDLRPAHDHHRLLRPELRLAGRSHRLAHRVPGLGRRGNRGHDRRHHRVAVAGRLPEQERPVVFRLRADPRWR